MTGAATGASPAGRKAKRYLPAEGLRLVFIAVLVVWVAFPFLIRGNLAQDALPYVVAGDFVRSHPESVYAAQDGDLFTLDPVFAQATCDAAPAGTDCADLSVAFVSTPPSIPFAMLIAALGPNLGVLAMRLIAALSLAAGMWLLWDRLADRTPHAARSLVITVLALTPFATVPIAMGQTSPILFLSAAIGVRSRRSIGRLVVIAGVWVAAIALKAFPAVLGVVLLWQRRWRLLTAGVAWTVALVGLTLALSPTSVWSDFFRTTEELSANTSVNPYNGSFDALVHSLFGSADLGAGSAVLTAVRLALLLVCTWWAARHLDDDSQWAYAYLLLLLVVPLVWWHYLWVAIAAVGLVLAARRTLDDRAVAVLPVLAVVTMPISIPNSRGWSVPVAQGLFLLVTVGLVPFLSEHGVRLPRRERREPSLAP